MARTPDEIWTEIRDLKHGVTSDTPYREAMHALADHNLRLADLWTELLHAIPVGAPVWAMNAAAQAAESAREEGRQQRRDAER